MTGENSRYRDPEKIKDLYGFLPENTVNPRRRLRRPERPVPGAEGGRRHEGSSTCSSSGSTAWTGRPRRPRRSSRRARSTTEGKGSGLIFQDYDAGGTAQYGFVVTSPTHDQNRPDVDTQTVVIPPTSLGGGYDARIAGPNPWTSARSARRPPGYFKGQSANAADARVCRPSAASCTPTPTRPRAPPRSISGVKSYNNGVNVTDDGRLVTTLFHELQDQGWKVGTVTSVPFDHVSPAAMYAQNVHRDDYQDLARAMLGLPGIIQESRHAPLAPGLDVVIGTGFGVITNPDVAGAAGHNGVLGNLFITDADLAAIDVKNGGKYVVVHTEPGVNGGRGVEAGRDRAARRSARLFGFFGRDGLDHLPYQTADGRYDPAPSIGSNGELRPAEAVYLGRPDRTADPGPDDRGRPDRPGQRARAAVRPVHRGRRRRFRPPRQQPRQRHRRGLQRRGGRPRRHPLGRSPQQLGRVGPDRLVRPRPLPGRR